MKALVLKVPEVVHQRKKDLVWHTGDAIKKLLLANENRQQLTWGNIKNNDDLKNMIKTLATWFQQPEDVVVAKFKS
jgi:hypothetical protein